MLINSSTIKKQLTNADYVLKFKFAMIDQFTLILILIIQNCFCGTQLLW